MPGCRGGIRTRVIQLMRLGWNRSSPLCKICIADFSFAPSANGSTRYCNVGGVRTDVAASVSGGSSEGVKMKCVLHNPLYTEQTELSIV